MQADRSGCPSSDDGVQRILMMVLLSSDHSPWSRTELERELSRPGDDPVDVADAIGALYAAGLVHIVGELVEPTRTARYLDGLFGTPA